MAHHYAATHGDQFGRMEVSTYQGEPMHLFAYWQAVTDKKGQTVVIKSAHWAGRRVRATGTRCSANGMTRQRDDSSRNDRS